MQRTKIDWPGLTHTWNPATGCRRGCNFCYARRIHERFNNVSFSTIQYHANRLTDPIKHKKPAVIFVGSMSDLEYWGYEQLETVLDVCRECPQHTFMFLSKSSEAYDRSDDWPANTMQGLTITGAEKHEARALEVLKLSKMPRPFLSVEPLLGLIYGTEIPDNINPVIVGAMTGPGSIKPQPEWIESVQYMVESERIYWKNSIKGMVQKCKQ